MREVEVLPIFKRNKESASTSKQNVLQTIKDSFDQIRTASRAIASARAEAAAAADDDDNQDDMDSVAADDDAEYKACLEGLYSPSD